MTQYISENPFCYIDSFFGKIKLYFLSFIGEHPLYKWAICFDLKKDPQENENIAENPIYMEKVEELSELIENRIGQ